MKKTAITLAIILSVLIGLWIIARVTNVLSWYTCSTPSNEPTLKTGSRFFASKMKTPGRLDFICYYGEVPNQERAIMVHRLCGLPGDKIEIKKGIAYINDQNIDQSLSLAHYYIVPITELEYVEKEFDVKEDQVLMVSDTTATIWLSNKAVKEKNYKGKRLVLSESDVDESIFKKFNQYWNQDNFGPVIVPENKYFVLGDNRHNAFDSRYNGFIDKKDYVATVVGRE